MKSAFLLKHLGGFFTVMAASSAATVFAQSSAPATAAPVALGAASISAPAGTTAVVSAAPPISGPSSGRALAPSLAISNVFDSQRAMWPDRIPPPPPPPPPAAPAQVGDNDLQLYGVAIVGNVKLATVKVGARFADSVPSERSFAQLREGQQVGEFTVGSITPSNIVLRAPGGNQTVPFTKKSDRSAAIASAPAVQPVQAPSDSIPRDAAGQPLGGLNPGASAGAGLLNAGGAKSPPSGVQTVPTDSTQPQATVSPAVNIQNSLAAAIANAQANIGTRPSTNDTLNPFTQKP